MVAGFQHESEKIPVDSGDMNWFLQGDGSLPPPALMG